MLIKGICSFPTLFTPKVAKGADAAKFSVQVLIPPNDPQIPQIQAAVQQAKADAFPSFTRLVPTTIDDSGLRRIASTGDS